jgi:pimeloyl-ACP methyl ester carboxylesterase
VPGCDRLLARAAVLTIRPTRGDKLTATGAPGARDLVRHALMDLGGNGNRVRSWAKAARRWPRDAHGDLRDAYAAMDFPVLLLWADEDEAHPLSLAEEALRVLPDAQLRVLPRTGFLIAYDDPVGLAREIVAFCG